MISTTFPLAREDISLLFRGWASVFIVSPPGIHISLGICVWGYTYHGDTHITVTPAHYVFISPLRSNTFCQMNFSTFQLKINEFSPSRCFFFFSVSRLSINKRDCDNGVLTVLLLATYDITVIGIICKEITWRAPCKNLFPFRRGCFLYWALQFDFDGKSEIGAICGTVQCRVLICHSVQKIIYGHDIILAGAKYASSSSWACKSNSPKPGSHLDID